MSERLEAIRETVRAMAEEDASRARERGVEEFRAYAENRWRGARANDLTDQEAVMRESTWLATAAETEASWTEALRSYPEAWSTYAIAVVDRALA